MFSVQDFINIIIHIDSYLLNIAHQYGLWTYPLIFLIIFLETGVVITPFLPGDSLLFAAGAIASIGGLNILLLYSLIAFAAILGDSVNYWIGFYIGNKISQKRIVNREYLARAEKFYGKHGAKTIVLARFIPIIRTFAPFVAGTARMDYSKFLFYNVFGGVIWTGIFVSAGYFLGNIPFVKEHFSYFVIIIIIASIIPIAIDFLRRKK